MWRCPRSVIPLGRQTLLHLLEAYDTAIGQLKSSSDPRIRAFRLRLERRRTEVIAALGALADQATAFR